VRKVDRKLLAMTIVDLLQRSGALKYEELYKQTKKRHDDLSEPEMDEALMKMEIEGLVRVYRIPKGKWRIELS
jgi:DNA-binding PadR family transcriptional regulator